jgi:two-component system, cell cycle sensor histidine kinase and response regulator CckA
MSLFCQVYVRIPILSERAFIMEKKPTTRFLNAAVIGLFSIIVISLVIVARGFYAVQQNAITSGEAQLMQTVAYITSDLKIAIENRALALENLAHGVSPKPELVTAENPIGFPADPQSQLDHYFHSIDSQSDILIFLNADGSFERAWQFQEETIRELSEEDARPYLAADPSLATILTAADVSQNSREYFIEKESYINMYNTLTAADGHTMGYFIAPLNLEKMFNTKIYRNDSNDNDYSGYPIVKNEEMNVLMHPVKNQVGLDIISGRQEQFPNLDFSDLKRLEEVQLSQEEGTLSYYSYWWDEKNPTKVLKLGAFQWIDVGLAHWVVSLNSDFYEHNRIPIQNNYILLSLILLISAIILILVILFRGYHKKNLAYEENQRLLEKQKFENERHRLENRILKENKLETIGLLTTTIVHDMNNFLTPILGNAQLLMDEYAENDELVSELKEIYLAAEKGKDLSTNVLRFSKVSEGQQNKDTDLSEVLKETLSEISMLTPKSIRIESDLAPGIIVAAFEKQDLQVVIYNLLTNAFQAIGKKRGKVTVSLKKANEECNAALQKRSVVTRETKYALLTIVDDGPGIAKELDIKDLFDPFFTTKGSNGTGLGLFVVSSIADKYDWQIKMETKEKGLTVTVCIPLQ